MSHRLHNAILLTLLSTLLVTSTSGHEAGAGAPKTECEPLGSSNIHEYGPPGTGFVILLGLDASIPPCPYGDTTWDGHLEWAFGGAWLQASASACTDAYPDHAPGALIAVQDAVLTGLGSEVAFSVYADTLNNDLVQSEPNCGDFESDYGVDCVNQCAPGFPPGLDGTYQVYVSGTSGHICGDPDDCSSATQVVDLGGADDVVWIQVDGQITLILPATSSCTGVGGLVAGQTYPPGSLPQQFTVGDDEVAYVDLLCEPTLSSFEAAGKRCVALGVHASKSGHENNYARARATCGTVVLECTASGPDVQTCDDSVDGANERTPYQCRKETKIQRPGTATARCSVRYR